MDNPQTGTPLVLAINAPWGAGKSSLGRMVDRRLREKVAADGDEPHVTCWFNAWMNDSAGSLAAALSAEVARTAHARLGFWKRVRSPLSWSIVSRSVRVGRLKWLAAFFIVILSILLAVSAFQKPGCDMTDGVPEFFCVGADVERSEASTATEAAALPWFAVLIAFVPAFASLVPQLFSVAQAVGTFVSRPKAESSTGSMQTVRNQLGGLIAQATPKGSRFVVFVDDIERCHPPRCVDLLEAINQLLDHSEVVVVVLGDMRAIAANVEIKYAGLAEKHDPGPIDRRSADRPIYGRLYLQKIIQYQFDLPPLAPGDITALLADATQVEESPSVQEVDQGPAEKAPPRQGDEHQRPSAKKVDASRRGFRDWVVDTIWRLDARPEATLAFARSRYRRMPGFIFYFLELALRPLIHGTRAGFPVSKRGPLDAPGEASPFDNVLVGSMFLHMAGSTLSVVGLWAAWATGMWRQLAGQAGPIDIGGLFALTIGAGIALLLMFSILYAPLYLLAYVRARRHAAVQARIREEVRAGARESLGDDVQSEVTGVEQYAQLRQNLGKRSWDRVVDQLERDKRYLEEQRRLRLINDSAQLREALAEVMQSLPRLPRNAKRLVNRLRVQLLLTDLRGLLGRDPTHVAPSAVGRWVLLQERWPELADALYTRPAAVDELVIAASRSGTTGHESYETTLTSLTSLYSRDDRLREYLARSQALTGKTLERLVRLRPLDGKLASYDTQTINS